METEVKTVKIDGPQFASTLYVRDIPVEVRFAFTPWGARRNAKKLEKLGTRLTSVA